MKMRIDLLEGKFIPTKAAADIAAGQLVEVVGDGEVQPTAGASSKVLGVALMNAKAGEKVTVVRKSVIIVTASEAITAGDLVKSAADGKVAKFAAGTDDPSLLLGFALTGGAADEEITIVLR